MGIGTFSHSGKKHILTDIQVPFVAHFHPSVSMFASRLLQSVEIPGKPDLSSHTMIHFLDRFVYRNAKTAASSLRGSSIMQPLAGGDSRGVFISNKTGQDKSISLNSEAFWYKRSEDVAVDEAFFHKYFTQIGKGKQSTRKGNKLWKGLDANEEDEEVQENEDAIWRALVESRPEVEGQNEDESDFEMLNLDDSDYHSSSDSDVGLKGGGGSDLKSTGLGDVSSHGSEADTASLDEEDLSDMDELFKKELQTNQQVELTAGDEKDRRMSKRRRLKNLPTFASTEEYAAMLQNDEDY